MSSSAPGPYGLVPHLARPEALVLAREVIARLEGLGATVRIPEPDARRVGLDAWACPESEFADGLRLAFSLGGDGTMLRTVDLVSAQGVPVLGVNVGHLGYLTTIQPEELNGLFDRIVAGDYLVERRMTLDIRIHRGDLADPSASAGAGAGAGGAAVPATRFLALNDAVLEKSSAGNTVRLAVSFNGEHFMDYSADGVIVATPTGSTAYAFSAHGPIVSPLMEALVVVPVSAHMLFDRSLVLDGRETVRAVVQEGRSATLFVDGRNAGTLGEGMWVDVERSAFPAQLVTFGERNFHAILKKKFGLAVDVPVTGPLTSAEAPSGGSPSGGGGAH